MRTHRKPNPASVVLFTLVGAICAFTTIPTSIAQTQPPAPTTSATESPSMPAADLSMLLDGIEDQCHYSSMLEGFWRALSDTNTASHQIDPALRPAVGPISVADEVDFTMYSIPLRGRWHQVPVKQIQFGLGKGNGIHVLMVEFDGPADAVRQVFEPMVERSKTAMDGDQDNAPSATTDLIIDDGKVRLVCDLST